MKTLGVIFLTAGLLVSSCTPTGQAMATGALDLLLLAQARYCSHPAAERLLLREQVRAAGVRMEMHCDDEKTP